MEAQQELEMGLQIKHLIPPAPSVSLAGQWLQAVPASISSPPWIFAWLEKAQGMWQ